MIEQWRPVPGYEGRYVVSDAGRVASVLGRWGVGRVLKLCPVRHGYLTVLLGHGARMYVHQVVALAFLGPCPAGHQVNHRDGAKANNRATNLEYVTPGENTRHAIAAGLWNSRGEHNGNSKLTARVVCEIRTMRARGGFSLRALGRRFGVSSSTIRDIVRRRIWRHVA